MFLSTSATTVAALAGLLTWQFSTSPELQRSSRAKRAAAEIQEVVNGSSLAELVEANVHFTPTDIKGQNTLLSTVYTQRRVGATMSSEDMRTRITRAIQIRLLHQGFNATPLIDVSVLDTPPRK